MSVPENPEWIPLSEAVQIIENMGAARFPYSGSAYDNLVAALSEGILDAHGFQYVNNTSHTNTPRKIPVEHWQNEANPFPKSFAKFSGLLNRTGTYVNPVIYKPEFEAWVERKLIVLVPPIKSFSSEDRTDAPADFPILEAIGAHKQTASKRGKKPTKTHKVKTQMLDDLNKKKITPENLQGMKQEYLAEKYSASRETACKARKEAISELF